MNPSRFRVFVSVAALFTLVAAPFLRADSTTAPADSASGPLTLYDTYPPNSIDQNLADTAPQAGLLPYGPVTLIDPAVKELNKNLNKIGLNVGFAYTILYQAATRGPGYRDAAGQDIDLFGDWRLLGKKGDPTTGYLYFAAEYRGEVDTPIPPGSLGSQIGSLWGTTNGFGEQVVTFKEVYWEQRFLTDQILFRIGKLDAENYYNSNYWQSDAKYFTNAAFSTFPVRAFPSNGLGINLTVKLTDLWTLSAGAQDAQGKKTTMGFDTLFQDFNLFSAGEVRFTPDIPNIGKGTYRLAAWYRDAGEENGKPYDTGIDFSADQRVGKNLVPFFRYGAGKGNINNIDQMLSAGIGWEGKLITKSDVLGIAGAWGQPSNSSLRDQYSAEVFYRMQLSPNNQFTIGYQGIFDPTNAPTEDAVGVFEIRWRIIF